MIPGVTGSGLTAAGFTGVGVGAAGAAAAAASLAGYHAMAPESQLYGQTFLGLAPGTKKIALTYDDGPNDPHTLQLLEALARHNVRATFFMIGRHVRQKPEVAREVAKAGHAIGNHTDSHPNLIFVSTTRLKVELSRCRDSIEQALGTHSNLFRPPFGGRRPQTLRVARAVGLLPVMWNVTGWDWNAKPADLIEPKITRQIRGGDVILLHDGGHLAMGADRSQTVILTGRLITRYKAEGYEFVTIPEMMAVAGESQAAR